ncbi:MULTISPECIES: hypothetical protein [unclassified Pseudodesulfovibrio]|uniref:hypothetical protein n=1 Tax=unclassified Pseudodesulfovibrio TaxID=2661612 RepID=UPI000FEC131F|nr:MULTISPECIES: hypothetical protein [unclassified Pseudodesulfovibrio]MCJ2165253.1 hypothetical protein [Pseudodesulfovibrio sp. S3-i]RWU03304.1 hypothetical protein DWB63_11940 [Pseudodesulfovibrio sp. S3]
MKSITLLVAAVAMAGLLFSVSALAGDTDPSGAQLRSAVEEYLKNAPASDSNANKIREAGGVNAASFPKVTEVLCGIEVATIVGKVIWDNRRELEPCYENIGMSGYQYCVVYSNNADNFSWYSSAMTERGCPTK